MNDRIKTAANFIRNKCGDSDIGLILGSGLADSIIPDNAQTLLYEDIPDFPVATAPGHKSEWVSGIINGKKISMMRGRFHYYEGYSAEDIIMPIRIMKLLGIKTLIVTNAAGAVNKSYNPGDLMLITDHINYSGFNPLIGANDDRFGTRFPDMSAVYDKRLAEIAHKCADSAGIKLNDGVYMWFSGPSYETPAEIRMARILGADAVGMSTVPEVIAAKHCGIKVLGISCMTNMAAGILDTPLSHEEVTETSNRIKNDFAKLITDIIGVI